MSSIKTEGLNGKLSGAKVDLYGSTGANISVKFSAPISEAISALGDKTGKLQPTDVNIIGGSLQIGAAKVGFSVDKVRNQGIKITAEAGF